MLAQAIAYWTILRISLEERLVYRGDFALATLMRFLPIITQIFLWWAVFDSVGGTASQNEVAGYRFQNVVAYYLLTMVGRAFSSMPGLASGIALQIRNGEIKKSGCISCNKCLDEMRNNTFRCVFNEKLIHF